MTSTGTTVSGRQASVARRQALSAGQAAIGRTAPAPAAPARTDGTPTNPPASSTVAMSLNGGGIRAVVPEARSASAPAAFTQAEAASAPALPPPARSAGRDASIQHRRAISAGQAATATGTGQRTTPRPDDRSASSAPPATAAARAAGRDASLMHRRQISAGKGAVSHGAGQPHSQSALAHSPPSAPTTLSQPAGGRGASILHRRQISAGKAGLLGSAAIPVLTPPPAPASPIGVAMAESRQGRRYPLKVTATATHGGQTVTGIRIGRGGDVTGDRRGATLPVSGTQYVGEESGATARFQPPKVGLARTPNGGVVSGTLVRSRIGITGDERGARQRITGEADQGEGDDLTPRSDAGARARQFGRSHDVHGQSAASPGFHLGRAGAHDSRHSDEGALERTLHGHSVTGTAVGESSRITGDDEGARATGWLTGTQYFRPATDRAGFDGHSHHHEMASRPDPVTHAKVVAMTTFGGQRVTGPQLEETPIATGSEAGAAAVVTGTPYLGAQSAAVSAGSAAAAAAAARVVRAPSHAPVTGRTPVNQAGVTGTERGADRVISGTPYYRGGAEPGDIHPLADVHHAFSVSSPQREAQLRSIADSAAHAEGHSSHITGSFAVGASRITGNTEFHFARRDAQPGERPTITGEGSSSFGRITGDSWRDQSRVTGTEGHFARNRNPSERSGKPQVFANARVFKAEEKHEAHPNNVTGILTVRADGKARGARVTVSGGAVT